MRRLSFLLCLALLVSQLGFSVESMAAAWARAGADSAVAAAASAHTLSSRIACDAFDAAACGDALHCEACQLCHGCHAPVLLTGELGQFFATPAQARPSTSAIGHLSAGSPPDFKPPIR